MFMLIRLFLLLLTRLWGWLALGAILIIIGVAFGASSYQVSYQTIDHGSFTPYVVSDGNDYLQTNGSTYYVINESELSPTFNGLSIFKSSQTFSMVARTDPQDVNVQLSDGTNLTGTGYKVEKIDVLDSSGNPTQSYVDSEYKQHPNGFYDNKWPSGAGLIVLGMIAGALAFFVPKRLNNKLLRSRKVAPAAAGVQDQAAPMPQANPYQQPYQNPSQYPGYSQYQDPAQQYQQQPPAYPSYPQYTDPASYQQPASQYPQYPQPSYPQQPPPNQQQGGSYEKTQVANPYDLPGQGQ